MRNALKQIRSANRKTIEELLAGIAIGLGGFNEITLVAMVYWIIFRYQSCTEFKCWKTLAKDAVIINMGILLVMYWSYIDPTSLSTWDIFNNGPKYCNITSIEGLKWQQLVKITCFVLFGLICNHNGLIKLRRLTTGVAIGLAMYVTPTIIGSFLMQGFRLGGNKIFDIFTGNVNAQSTTVGYVIIIIVGVLTANRSQLAVPAILFGFFASLQASDKGLFVFNLLAIFYAFRGIPAQCLRRIKFKYRAISLCFFSIAMISIFSALVYHTNMLSLFSGSFYERYSLYLDGYQRLSHYLIGNTGNTLSIIDNPIDNTLAVTDPYYRQCMNSGCDFTGWHSVPLDAARASGIVGAIFALTWLIALASCFFIFIYKNESRLYLLALGALFIYMTSLVLHAGSYEFIGLSSGTLLIINEALPNKSLKSEQR